MKRVHRNDISNLPTKKHPSIDLPTKKYPSIGAKNHGDNKRKFVHFAGKGIFLGVFIGLAIYGIFYVWSWSISTSKAQPETFTELYFEDSLQLPSKVVPKHPYYFQFTLHNLEGKDMEYPFEVYVEVGQDKLIFDKGTVFVKQNGYITIPERFTTTSVWPKSEIVVDLINKNQQIDFWIEGSKE